MLFSGFSSPLTWRHSPGSTPYMSPWLCKSVIVNRQCGYGKLLGVVILGYSTPRNFWFASAQL